MLGDVIVDRNSVDSAVRKLKVNGIIWHISIFSVSLVNHNSCHKVWTLITHPAAESLMKRRPELCLNHS